MKEQIPRDLLDQLYAIEYDLLEDPTGKALEEVYRYGLVDDFTRSLMKSRIRSNEIELKKSPFHRPHRLRRGDFCQGLDIKGYEIRFPSQWLNEPKLIIASTGSGKTTLARYEILILATVVPQMWLFDFRKAEFGVLQSYFARLSKHLNVITARQMKFNPLQLPKHVDAIAYASNLSDVLVRVMDLPPVASRLLFQTILQLYRKFGVLDGGHNFPTIFDLLHAIIVNKQANSQAREALRLRLETMLLSLGKVLAYRQGWSTEELSKHCINFQFNDVGEVDQNLLLNLLLLHEFMSRIAQGASNVRMNLIIYCDEASRLVSNSDTSLSQFIGLIRGTGIGLSLSNQSAEISRSILSNTPNKIIGRCSSAADYGVMASCIGLSAEQKRWLTIHLKKPGLFLGSLGQAEYPFLFTVPNLKFKKSDFIFNNSCPELESLRVVPADEFFNWSPISQQEIVMETNDSQPEPSDGGNGINSTRLELNPDELRYLREVVKSPMKPISYYPSRIQMGTAHALKIRKSLIQKGYIKLEKLQINPGRGRPSSILIPTELALQAVSNDLGE
tara:strand:- start:8053 stop:9729 length:1677 start_codon:yes stop_codon:yes gene_type:complete